MKSVLLIGLGRFGRHMAEKLLEEGNEVLGVDICEERVNDAMDMLTNAQIGDATNELFVESLGVRNFDLCVVAIGDNFQFFRDYSTFKGLWCALCVVKSK